MPLILPVPHHTEKRKDFAKLGCSRRKPGLLQGSQLEWTSTKPKPGFFFSLSSQTFKKKKLSNSVHPNISEFPITGMLEQEVDIISAQQTPTQHLLWPDPMKGWAFGDAYDPILAIWELVDWFRRPDG